jgi:hypothetical protein
MKCFSHNLDLVFDKMETQYFSYPIMTFINFIYSYFNFKNLNTN